MRWNLFSVRLLMLCLSTVHFNLESFADSAVQRHATEQLKWEHPSKAVVMLRQSHASDHSTFVIQDELDFLIPKEGGGACASAAAIDVLQFLRVMSRLEKLANPHQVVLGAFKEQPELLKGRVSNESLVKLFKHYEIHLADNSLKVSVTSAPNSAHANGSKIWRVNRGPNLKVKPGQIKVLSYTVTKADGTVLGRHFVLLTGFNGDQIEVVDPSSPLKPYLYRLEFKAGSTGDRERVFLLRPTGVSGKQITLELNTVFRIALRKKPNISDARSQQATSVDQINRQIDELAGKLKQTNEWQSPRAWRKNSANFGLPGLDLPTKFGGSDWPTTKMIEVFRHAGAHNLNFRDVVGGAHVRALKESDDLEVQEIVREVVRGNAYIAIAITEPEVGTNVRGMKSVSQRVEGGYLLTGEKRYNARLEQATHVIIFAQGTTGKAGKLSVFVVPIGSPGLTIEQLTPHGLAGNSYGGLKFTNLFIPENCLIGEDGEGMRAFYKHFLYWRLMQTAAAIGTAENALDQMAERLKTREVFGAPIGRFTHLQQPLGQHTIELKMAWSLCKEAAQLIDQGNDDEAYAIICGLKAEGVEIALRAVDAATRAFGGEGYSTRVDLGDRLKDLNGLRIADGTTDVMRSEVVRRIYGEEFWQMVVEPKSEK